MKNMKNLLLISMAVGILTACASIAVTENHLIQRTSLVLDLEPSEFTISNRTNDGFRSDYLVNTKAMGRYSCYVDGFFSITGRTVTDAVCTELPSSSVSANTGKSKH